MTYKMLTTLVFILSATLANAQSHKRTFVTGDFKELVIPTAKVESNFRRAYPDINDEKWSTENGYYFAIFTKGEIKNQVVYTEKGHLDYSLKVYSEKILPAAVRSTVKSVYYDYKITNAQELEIANKTIYLINLSGAKAFKTIRVHNGEMEEIESYSTVISPCR